MSNLDFSRKWAANLAQMHHLNKDKEAEIAYAIQILALNIVNTILTLTVGWVLGVFWGTLTCLLTIAAFRHNGGGGHSESPWRCALVTMIVFPLLALAARELSIGSVFYIDILSVGSILIGFILLLIYAPVDNPKAPIISPVRRKRLKVLALLVMAVIALIMLGLNFINWGKALEIRTCLALSILWFSFNLTPWGHNLWSFIDKIKLK